MKLLKVTLLVGLISTASFGLSKYEAAYNTVHNVLKQIALNASQHAKMESSLKILKGLVKDKSDKERKAIKAASDKKIIDAYLKKKKGKK